MKAHEPQPRQLLFDITAAALLMIFALIATVEVTGQLFSRDASWVHTLLIVLMTAPLALRRIYPSWVFGVVVMAWVVDRGLDYPGGLEALGVVVAFYTIGAEAPAKRSLLVGGGSAVFVMFWTTLGALTLESVDFISVATTGISTLTPFLVGREMRARRDRAEDLRRRVEDSERERQELARQAIKDERDRIARELHDVVAHQMTVMTLQAEGARRVASEEDPHVIDALDTIIEAGRSALGDMRKVVGLLRDGESGDADLAPLPGLADLDKLISQVESAGLSATLETTGEPRELSEVVELCAFRIVQESLTNAVRHGGPGTKAEIALLYGPESLDIEVLDTGRGAAAAPSNGGGHGIVGMKERVAVLGGKFDAGPKQGGGFLVRAKLPYQT